VFWLQVISALAVVLVTLLVATGRGDALGALPPRHSPRLPDDRAVEPADVVGLRLPVALRGYRMDAVDDALDRLADEIALRDAQIAQLRDRLEPSAAESSLGDRGPAGG
jgi:DivIVA domain-containing protein